MTNLPSPPTTGITETSTINSSNNQITGQTGATAKSYSYDVTWPEGLLSGTKWSKIDLHSK